jgi:hypothetical protein
MPFRKHDRQYDIVVFGATGSGSMLLYLSDSELTAIPGYTGVLTTEHITANLPLDLKWAIAGRSAKKLEELSLRCKELRPDRTPPGRVHTHILSNARLTSISVIKRSKFATSMTKKQLH